MSKKEQQKTRLKSDIVELNQHLGSEVFNYEEPLPLALGVNDELKESLGDWDDVRIQRFLARYTQRRRYKAALAKPDAKRFHLDGSEAGSVIEPHRERAEEALNPPPKPAKPAPVKKGARKARSKGDGGRERHAGKPKIMVRRKTTLAKPATASSVDEEKAKGDLKVVYKRRRIVLPPKDKGSENDG